jgi:anaerobic sulfite reductase subunit C
MKWTDEANEALSWVPFFIRKRVRKRVEEEASRCGASAVTLEHVKTCQKRFLNQMEDEVRGYQVETCFGANGCPNRAVEFEGVAGKIEEILSGRDLKPFLRNRVEGPLKMHHEFRVSISDCPNACSRPQIADLGLIGARTPAVGDEPCSRCGACVPPCREAAVALAAERPVIDARACLSCGKCVSVCPTGTLRQERRGFRILFGGKLGRHPRLALELPGVHDLQQTLQIVQSCLDYYQMNCTRGERFGEILERTGADPRKLFSPTGKGGKEEK